MFSVFTFQISPLSLLPRLLVAFVCSVPHYKSVGVKLSLPALQRAEDVELGEYISGWEGLEKRACVCEDRLQAAKPRGGADWLPPSPFISFLSFFGDKLASNFLYL